MTKLPGFKKVESVTLPEGGGRCGGSKYDELIKEVHEEGSIYFIDMGDRKHAHSMANNLRRLLKRRGIDDVLVGVRGIKVYVSRKED